MEQNIIPPHIQEVADKIQDGYAMLPPPMGYVIGWKKNKKTILIDKQKSRIAQEIFKLYSTGEVSLDDVSISLSKKYNRSISRTGISNTLRNPFYKGYIDIKGFLFPHPYPLFIEKELWERCNTILDEYRKKRTNMSTHKDSDLEKMGMYLYRKIIRCGECDKYLTSTYVKKKNIVYYHCADLPKHTNIPKKKNASLYDINIFITTLLKQCGIENFEKILKKDIKEARSILEQNIQFLSYSGGRFKYAFGQNFLYRPYRDTTKSSKNKIFAKVNNDPLLNFLSTSRDMEEISQFLQKDTVECSNILMDYVLEDKIEESSGLWKIK